MKPPNLSVSKSSGNEKEYITLYHAAKAKWKRQRGVVESSTNVRENPFPTYLLYPNYPSHICRQASLCGKKKDFETQAGFRFFEMADVALTIPSN